MKRYSSLGLLVGAAAWLATSASALPTRVRNDMPVTHSHDASDFLRTAAGEVTDVLRRMTGGNHAVESGGEPAGIVIGTVAQFPDAPRAKELDPADILRREEYIVHTDGSRIWLIGATEAGANHAAWDFLHRLGYRLYFPGSNWEITPRITAPEIDWNEIIAPDYVARVFAWHYGNWPELAKDVERWLLRNRIAPARTFPEVFQLRTSHIYGGIIKAFQEEFDAHPDMRSIVDGKPTSKLNPTNPRTLEVIRRFTADYFEKNPEAGSISMDPSDGGGWGTSPEELAIGTPSDRATLIANTAAEFANERFGQRYVGLYAYNEHSPPPTKVRVHPSVIISVATSFIRGGLKVPELMDGWRESGAKMLGVREYHSVVAWDGSRPAAGRGAKLGYLAQTIPEFHQRGARFYITEAGQNWASQGLGNYLTARWLWDVDEVEEKDASIERFIDDCFPQAKTPMTEFYRGLLHAEKPRPFSRDFIGRMYGLLGAARKLTTDEGALRRLDDLLLYTRFSELMFEYRLSTSRGKGPKPQIEALEALIRFTYRIRKAHMVSGYAVYRDLPNRNRELKGMPFPDWKVPENENPWKSSDPFGADELKDILKNGIAANPVVDMDPVVFSRELVPATPLLNGTPEARPMTSLGIVRGLNQILVWVGDATQPVRFTLRTGLIYTTLGDVRVRLVRLDPDTGDAGQVETEEDGGRPVFTQADDEAVFPADKGSHAVSLKPSGTGPYLLVLEDSLGGVQIEDWPEKAFFTFESSLGQTVNHGSRSNFYFYVPKGTRVVGAFVRGKGEVRDDLDKILHRLSGDPEFISIDVPEGRDGKFWKFAGLVGGRMELLTVPPYMAGSPRQLLLPREVVEADTPAKHQP